MKSEKSVLAIIPARGGSKGILRKNMTDLGGKPLFLWTVKAALESRYIDRVIVSTEDTEIAQCALDAGAQVPALRPVELAQDHVHSNDAVFHALETWCTAEPPEIVVALLPTSPFRTASQIDEAIELYLQHPEAESVVSVCELDKQMPHLRHLKHAFLEPLNAQENLDVQRQDLEPLYALNGAIHIASFQQLLKKRTFHTSKTLGYVMHWFHSTDIDHPDDLQLAKILLLHQHLFSF